MLSSVAALCTLVGSCATVPGPTRPGGSGGAAPAAEPASVLFRAVPFSALPGWSDDTPSAALPSFAASCRALIARPESAATWRRACAAASAVAIRDDAAARAFFEAQFTPYEVTTADGIDAGRVTGYYEPMLKGSRVRNDRYRYPLYAPPDDLLTVELGEIFPELKSERVRGRLDGKRVVPYWSRSEIDAGQARLSGRELIWLDDPIEAFFVQIQGSARIELADRSSVRVGYADQNGHPYRSIGRVLIERGELTLDKASMQGIKAWARQHPDSAALASRRKSKLCLFAKSPPIRSMASTDRSVRWAYRLSRAGPSRWTPAFCRWVHPSFWRRPILSPTRACSGWSWRRTPVARSEGLCVPITSGARATTQGETRAG